MCMYTHKPSSRLVQKLFRGQQRPNTVPQLHVLMTTEYMCLATQTNMCVANNTIIETSTASSSIVKTWPAIVDMNYLNSVIRVIKLLYMASMRNFYQSRIVYYQRLVVKFANLCRIQGQTAHILYIFCSVKMCPPSILIGACFSHLCFPPEIAYTNIDVCNICAAAKISSHLSPAWVGVGWEHRTRTICLLSWCEVHFVSCGYILVWGPGHIRDYGSGWEGFVPEECNYPAVRRL